MRTDACVYWSKTQGEHVLGCPDDLCRNGSTTLCGLEEGVDFHEGSNDFYEGYEDL